MVLKHKREKFEEKTQFWTKRKIISLITFNLLGLIIDIFDFHNFLMKIIFLQIFLPFTADFVAKVVETVVVIVLFLVVVIVLLLVVDAVA